MSNSNSKRRKAKKQSIKAGTYSPLADILQVSQERREQITGKVMDTVKRVGTIGHVAVNTFFKPAQHQRRQYTSTVGDTAFTGVILPKRDKWDTPVWPEDIVLVDGRHPMAGKKNHLCYRTACQRPGAIYFNKSTHKYYCPQCAHDLNRVNWDYWEAPLCTLNDAEYIDG